jgi:hypothetical protein
MENENTLDFFEDSVNDWLDTVIESVDMGAGGAPAPEGPAALPGLPCLYIHNVIRREDKPSPKLVGLSEKWRGKQALPKADRTRANGYISPREKKAANMLFLNAADLLQRGVERCAFVTITTPQNMSYWTKEGWGEARAMFRSWIGNKTGFPYVFGVDRNWCRVIEPQQRGAIHWHLLIDLGAGVDIRTGVDFQAFKDRDYRTAPYALRCLWARMRESAKRYHLGRTEIMPVRADKWEACARYVGKYISKAVNRETWENTCDNKAKPLHARRVGFSQGWKVANTNYSWVENGQEWRRGVALLACVVGAESYDDLKQILGPKWAWNNKDFIQNPSAYDHEGEENPL